jgi:taurine dioxygenase
MSGTPATSWWDNRATMHRVMLDYPVGESRVMQRVLIEGDRPV